MPQLLQVAAGQHLNGPKSPMPSPTASSPTWDAVPAQADSKGARCHKGIKLMEPSSTHKVAPSAPLCLTVLGTSGTRSTLCKLRSASLCFWHSHAQCLPIPCQPPQGHGMGLTRALQGLCYPSHRTHPGFGRTAVRRE